jgi:hypothetical protein
MIILLRNIIFISVLIFSGSLLFAQKLATPLEPQAPPKQTEVGIVFGLGNNFQSGIYQPECETCKFENAQGLGITVGAIYIKDFVPEFQWGSLLTFSTLNSETSYQKTELNKIRTNPPFSYEERPIPYRNKAEFKISEISLNPFLQWQPLDFMFFRLGIGTTIISQNNFIQTKELLKFRDTLSTGEIVDLKFDSTHTKMITLEDNNIKGTNIIQFSLEPMLGFNFEISNQIYFLPYFSYSIPLTSFSSEQTNLNFSKWRIMLELRLALQLRNIKIN